MKYLSLQPNEKEALERKLWYRIFKVVSWLTIIVLTVSLGGMAFSDNAPTQKITLPRFVCNTDSEWDELQKIRVWAYPPTGVNEIFTDVEDIENCEEGATTYARVENTQTFGSWKGAIGAGLLAVGIIFGASLLVYAVLRRLLVYIIHRRIGQE